MNKVCILLLFVFFVYSCNNKLGGQTEEQHEDLTAKKMLQGIWINADDETVAFKVQGDSIFYPDSTSLPVTFKIIKDTLILQSASVVKYPIVKQAEHLFMFKNQAGDVVKLTLSENLGDKYQFENTVVQAVNQNRLIKRDTIISCNGVRYHAYVQVNPTTYKIIKPAYNDDGVEVDNVYYDNIINLAIFKGATRLFSRDFAKDAFSHLVPKDFLRQSVLSDMIFQRLDDKGIHYDVIIGIPDSPSGYLVHLLVSYDGKMSMRIDD